MEAFFRRDATQSCERVILPGKPNSQRGDSSYIGRGLDGKFTSLEAQNTWLEGV
jgi:hypothetical protein